MKAEPLLGATPCLDGGKLLQWTSNTNSDENPIPKCVGDGTNQRARVQRKNRKMKKKKKKNEKMMMTMTMRKTSDCHQACGWGM